MNNTDAQMDTFSAYATHKIHKVLKVHSSRRQVNVLTPVISGNHARCIGVGDELGNHFYPPARGNVREHIRACVTDVIERHQWVGDVYELGFVEAMHERGVYTVTLWVRN